MKLTNTLEQQENQVKTAERQLARLMPDRFSHLSQLLKRLTWKRLRGGALFALGYLLSPLCWWNDLVFNLPIAYGFGYLCSLYSSNWLLPGLIGGYWLSNVIGILMMQFGAIDALQGQPKERNLKKELLSGIVSSTIYTFLILALVQFKVLDIPDLPALIAEDGSLSVSALLPLIIAGFKGGA